MKRFYLGCKLDPTSSLEIKGHEKGTGKGSLGCKVEKKPIVTVQLEGTSPDDNCSRRQDGAKN